MSRRAIRSESCFTKVMSAVVGPHVEAVVGGGGREIARRAGRRALYGSTLWKTGWGA